MDKWLKHVIFALCLALAGGAAPAAAELRATHPSHYAEPGSSLQGGAGATRKRTRQVRAGSNVILRDAGALSGSWFLNEDLSRACAKHLFRQKRDQFLVAIVDGRTYGAAVGGHSSLIDRANMAINQTVYLFRGQGTTDCRVYHRTRSAF